MVSDDWCTIGKTLHDWVVPNFMDMLTSSKPLSLDDLRPEDDHGSCQRTFYIKKTGAKHE
jgi:hypothetical protein